MRKSLWRAREEARLEANVRRKVEVERTAAQEEVQRARAENHILSEASRASAAEDARKLREQSAACEQRLAIERQAKEVAARREVGACKRLLNILEP